jgi:hypothetical protein
MAQVNATHAHAYDTAFQHLSGTAPLAFPIRQAIKFYQEIIQDPLVFTIVREPLSHALSWLAYFKIPKSIEELQDLVIGPAMPVNPLAADFALRTHSDVESFLHTEIHNFRLVCLAEAFDECLVMLKRVLNWSFLDITYLRLLDASSTPL